MIFISLEIYVSWRSSRGKQIQLLPLHADAVRVVVVAARVRTIETVDRIERRFP